MLTESPQVIAGRMRRHHRRVIDHLLRTGSRDRGLTRMEHARLSQLAHFRSAPTELGFTPVEVLAHLRDHALWTYEALRRLRFEVGPRLTPMDPRRPGEFGLGGLDGKGLEEQLRIANALLSAAAGAVPPEELDHPGEVVGVGVRSLEEVLLDEVQHLEDHLAQLDAWQGAGP